MGRGGERRAPPRSPPLPRSPIPSMARCEEMSMRFCYARAEFSAGSVVGNEVESRRGEVGRGGGRWEEVGRRLGKLGKLRQLMRSVDYNCLLVYIHEAGPTRNVTPHGR